MNPAVPLCKYFGECGGCQLQDLAEVEYRAFKVGFVQGALRRRGLIIEDVPLIDAHGAGRRRVATHVRRDGEKVTAGFMAAKSHRLVDIDQCPILVPALADAMAISREIGEAAGNADVWITATDSGLDVAVKAERKQAEISLPKLTTIAMARRLARLSLNGDVLLTNSTPSVRMGKARVAVPPGSFLQATARGEEVLAGLVLEGLGKAKHVADLFCGLGPFALRIAERARVAAFDSDKAAVGALQAAVKATQGLKPVTSAVRNLMSEPLVAGELKEFDAVVLDPPRAGAETQCRKLAASSVKRIAYASCDPDTFARDAAILVAAGYKLVKITAVDQFRFSRHIECVGALRR